MKDKNIYAESSKNTILNSHVKAKGNIHVGDIINIHNRSKDKKKDVEVSSLGSFDTKHLKKLLAEGKLKQCLEILLDSAGEVDEDLHHQIIHQSNRYNRFTKDKGLNIINFENAELIHARIVNATLQIITELKKE